jgi:hypothetical protein
MANEVLSINIFDKHYELPKDIITYINEHHCFEGYRQELLVYFTDNYYDYQNLSGEIERKVYETFRHYGNLCVQKLIANNIFNVTVDELVGSLPEKYTWKSCSDASTNDGVKLFYKTLCEAMTEQANALLEQLNSFMSQAQRAERERDSKITGTGFGIITNDLIGFGIWAAMENKAIKQQSSAANADFCSEIDEIQRKLEQTSKSRLSRFGREVWLPGLKNATDLFIISLFQKYIDILISSDKFSPDALNYIDITKSQSILQNIDATDNKVGILDAAFLSCPFNPELYDTAISICNVDEVVICAKLFGVDEYLKLKYTDICNEIAQDDNYGEKEIVEKISPYVHLLSLLDEKTLEEIQVDFLSVHRNLIKEKILEMSNCLQSASDEVIKSFVKSITATPISELVDDSEKELQKHIISKIISDLFKKDEPKVYESIIYQVAEKMMLVIKSYFSKVSKAKNEYLSKKEEYDKYKQSTDEEVRKINEQLSTLGMFSFSKKKELNARISSLQECAVELERSCATLEKVYHNLI